MGMWFCLLLLAPSAPRLDLSPEPPQVSQSAPPPAAGSCGSPPPATACWLPGEPGAAEEEADNAIEAPHKQVQIRYPTPIIDGQLLPLALELADDCPTAELLWEGQIFAPYRVRPDLWHVLLPMPLGRRPGPRPLQVRCGANLVPFSLEVGAGTYPESRLSVDPKFTAPPPPCTAQESAAIAAAFRSSGPRRLWQEAFVRPHPGPLTSPFGVRRTFNQEVKGRHLGLDFGAAPGEPIRAANAGVVALAAADFFFVGNAVLLDHGQGLYTLYFHMTELQVKTGDTVTRGQQLGTIGATGRVTGPHLHFAVKYAGTYVNPADLLAYNPQAMLGPAAAEVPTAEELQAAEGEAPTGRR